MFAPLDTENFFKQMTKKKTANCVKILIFVLISEFDREKNGGYMCNAFPRVYPD